MTTETAATLSSLLVEQAPDAVIFAGPDGVIQFWNAAAAAMFGLSEAEAVGQDLNIIIPEQFQGYPGVVHGGVVAAILDEAAGRSHMVEYTLGGESRTRFMLTARMELRYRQNAPVGQPLRLVGRAGKSKGRTAQASAYLYDQSGSLLAEAEAVLVDLPDDVLPSGGLESLGWKVYPEAGVET